MSPTATVGSIVVLGADEVHHQHIERLTTVCERSGVRLVLFFQHLREQTRQLLGGGEVCFMRLGNHQEAQQAAEFIGRQHKFVLSQLTRTLGGNETHTVAVSEGYSISEGHSVAKGGYSGSSGGQRHGGSFWSRTRNWDHTRDWSQTLSTATGTNWSNATSAQRVYEFAVEPRGAGRRRRHVRRRRRRSPVRAAAAARPGAGRHHALGDALADAVSLAQPGHPAKDEETPAAAQDDQLP